MTKTKGYRCRGWAAAAAAGQTKQTVLITPQTVCLCPLGANRVGTIWYWEGNPLQQMGTESASAFSTPWSSTFTESTWQSEQTHCSPLFRERLQISLGKWDPRQLDPGHWAVWQQGPKKLDPLPIDWWSRGQFYQSADILCLNISQKPDYNPAERGCTCKLDKIPWESWAACNHPNWRQHWLWSRFRKQPGWVFWQALGTYEPSYVPCVIQKPLWQTTSSALWESHGN